MLNNILELFVNVLSSCLLVSRAVFVYNCYPACRWVGRSVVLATSLCSTHSKRHNNMYLHLKCQPPLLTRQPPNESLLCNCVTWNVAIFCWPGLAILVMHKNKKIIFVTSFVSRLQVGRWVGEVPVCPHYSQRCVSTYYLRSLNLSGSR